MENGDWTYVPPSTPSRCTWHLKGQASPHSTEKIVPREKILPNIVAAIGQTPMVRINSLSKEYGIQCELLAKCEFVNPGGSLKDRIVPRMIEDAKKQGLIKPGCTIIAPTSGNTGIGAAMISAVNGYRCIIVMPQKMSKEKADTMRALGAEIIRTPNSAGYLSLESPFAVSERLHREIPNSFILNQYNLPGNALAHYDITAEEILSQCDGQLDMIIIGTGTGGTLTGIGRKIKEKCPKCQVIAVDPVGSIMAHPNDRSTKAFFEVEGIGHDFVPTVCDSNVVDRWVKVQDKDTFNMARRIIREEGILCGGSSGTNMVAALQVAKDLKAGQKCVVLLPDGIRNYMTKFLDDQWMLERGYIDDTESAISEQKWAQLPVSRLINQPGEHVKLSDTCNNALAKMRAQGRTSMAVLEDNGTVKGIITEQSLVNQIVEGRLSAKCCVDDLINLSFRKVTQDVPLARVARILQSEPLVVVVTDSSIAGKEEFLGSVSRMEFVNFTTGKDSM